jgi:hypothetical protein
MNNLLSINNSAERCKQEGIPLSEKAIRQFVKSGEIPAVFTGKKALIYFPNIVEFIKTEIRELCSLNSYKVRFALLARGGDFVD